MSGYPEYNEDPRQDEPMRRLGSRELARILREREAEAGARTVVTLGHDDMGSAMYGFCLAQSVALWTVPETHKFAVWVDPSEPSPGSWEPGFWASGPSQWAGEQVALIWGAAGACPDSEPGVEEAALADPTVLSAGQIADLLDSLPDLPVALGMSGDPEMGPIEHISAVDWACHPEECTYPIFQPAGARVAQVQPPCPDDVSLAEWDTREPVLVQWPATVDLWNSEICWVRPD